MKRIAIWGYFGGYGGIECLVFNLYKNIDREKIQFDFLVPHDCGEISFEKEILAMGGRVFRILYSQRESISKYRKCWMDFFKEHPEVNGIHVHANFQYAFPLVMAKKAGIPLRILHSHNSQQTNADTKIISMLRNWKVQREIAKAPTTYLACTDMAAQFMFPQKPYIWLKNGIDVDKFDYNQAAREKLRRQYNISENEILFGIVGHLIDVKNPLFSLDVLNEYIKINKHCKLVVIGDGNLKESMEEKISEYKIQNHVIFLGRINDVSEWYQAMDMLLFPSKFEGLGIVLIEAQTSGLLCMASDKVPEDAKVTELVEFQSIDVRPEIWAQRIDKILENNTNQRRSHKEEILAAGYDLKQVSKQLENIYLS